MTAQSWRGSLDRRRNIAMRPQPEWAWRAGSMTVRWRVSTPLRVMAVPIVRSIVRVRLSRGFAVALVGCFGLAACSGTGQVNAGQNNAATCVVPFPHASTRHVRIGGTVVLSDSGIGCHPDFSGPHTITTRGVPNHHPSRAMKLVASVSRGAFRVRVRVPSDWDPGVVVFQLFGPLVDRSCPPNASCKAQEVTVRTYARRRPVPAWALRCLPRGSARVGPASSYVGLTPAEGERRSRHHDGDSLVWVGGGGRCSHFDDQVVRTHPIAVVSSTRLIADPGARVIAAARAVDGWQP
jgi:hypothetical protein